MTTPKIETPKSVDEIPGGLFDQAGVSPQEAAEGLLEALGSDDDELFEELEDSEQSTLDEEADEADEDEEESEEEEEADEADEESDDESDEDEGDDEELEEDLHEVPDPDAEGGTRKVTLQELRDGYSRTADYTRKRQRDAGEHNTAMTEAREVRTKYAEGLAKLEETLSRMGPQEPDAALRKSNPGEYAAQIAEYREYQDTLGKVGQAQEIVSEEEAAEIRVAQQGYVNDEWAKIVTAVPEWKDEAIATAALAELQKFAMSEYGFEKAEIEGLADSRLFLMLKGNYDLQGKRKKGAAVLERKKKASKKLRAGSARTPKARSKGRKKQQQRADELAATTGSVKDAARAIEMLLDD